MQQIGWSAFGCICDKPYIIFGIELIDLKTNFFKLTDDFIVQQIVATPKINLIIHCDAELPRELLSLDVYTTANNLRNQHLIWYIHALYIHVRIILD